MQQVPISKVKPNPFQPRKYFDPDGQEVLKQTLKRQIMPILVLRGSTKDIPKDVKVRPDEHLIIDGERRWRALKDLGRREIAIEVLKDSYTDAFHNSLIIHRTTARHTDVERARGILDSIMNKFQGNPWFDEFGTGRQAAVRCAQHIYNVEREHSKPKMGQARLAEFKEWCAKAGYALNTVALDLARLADVPPDVEEWAAKTGFSGSHAQQVARIEKPALREKFMKRLERKPLTWHEAQKAARVLADEEVADDLKEEVLRGKRDIEEIAEEADASSVARRRIEEWQTKKAYPSKEVLDVKKQTEEIMNEVLSKSRALVDVLERTQGMKFVPYIDYRVKAEILVNLAIIADFYSYLKTGRKAPWEGEKLIGKGS